MSNGTLLTKYELVSGLADNNNKEITASDVQNIVKSNYQPVMIFTGVFVRDNVLGNLWYPRTNYYNPDFFQPRSDGGGLMTSSQIWRFTNRGAGLLQNHTYTNVAVNPSAWPGDTTRDYIAAVTRSARFNVYTDSNGTVDRYDIISSGSGWFGPAGVKTNNNWTYPGQTGTLNLSGAGITSPTVEFIGPVVWDPANGTTNSPNYTLSQNANVPGATVPGQGLSAPHRFLNTLVQLTLSEGKGNNEYIPGARIDPQTNNKLEIQGIRSNAEDPAINITMWRMPF
tara:strand:+ start:86 stop:934 length:849 start_codon:yes stop_codon:yes gene_type:complete